MRRHSRSYRCTRCWKPFGALNKVKEHQQQQPVCESKPEPEQEKLMSVDCEQAMKLIPPNPPDEAWWRYFQLLIPGMQDRNLNDLKNEYWPCKQGDLQIFAGRKERY